MRSCPCTPARRSFRISATTLCQAKSCPFAYNFEALERSYLHLALQYALQRWLASQGFTAQLEHTLPDGGRADIHVSVDPGAQTIEVQLSPLQLGTWEARTALYARQVDHVTWLFGPRWLGRVCP